MHFIYGRVRRLRLKERIFEIKIKNKITYFYLSRSQMKQFNAYLQEGLFIHLRCQDNLVRHGKVMAYEVVNFIKMIRRSHHKITVYFDIATIKKGVQKVINKQGNRMFLDLEFTMPPYMYPAGSDFTAEIIQYGLYLEDENGQVILQEDNLIKPLKSNALNARTFNFLNLKPKHFKQAISYRTFYSRLKSLLSTYKPIIYVWGKNDIIVLEKSYEMHKVKPVTNRMDFVNLMQIIKNYFGIKRDIGLFNSFTYFDDEPLQEQSHDAMMDALVTREVFYRFRHYINANE